MPDAQLTLEEQVLVNRLADVWNLYLQLEPYDMLDSIDFSKAIHVAQNLIAVRVARRANPELWRQTGEP
jgi:hypothetical protein